MSGEDLPAQIAGFHVNEPLGPGSGRTVAVTMAVRHHVLSPSLLQYFSRKRTAGERNVAQVLAPEPKGPPENLSALSRTLPLDQNGSTAAGVMGDIKVVQQGRVLEGALLPEWADSMVQLGAVLYRRGTLRKPLRVCVTLPTSSMAAAFVATGASIASMLDSTSLDPVAHYERLCDLEPGTPIAILNQGMVRSGWIEGPAHVMDQDCISYMERRTHHDERRYLFRERALDIEPLPVGAQPFAIARTPFESLDAPGLLETMRAGAATDMAIKTEHASVVLSRLSAMERDLEEPISFADNNSVPLLDLVRPDRLLRGGTATRTQLVPSSADDEPGVVQDTAPLAIFDGPQGYLRLRHRVAAPNWILILDRWDAGSPDAASAFLTDFGWTHSDSALRDYQPVDSVELLAIEERV